MKTVFASSAVLLLATTALSAPALADTRDDRIAALEQRLEAALAEIRALKQEQASEKASSDAIAGQVADLKRVQATPAGAAQAMAVQAGGQPAAKTADAKLTFANNRPTITSADGRSSLSIRSIVQFDAAYFSQNGRGASGADLSSGTNFRRARLGVDGKIAGDWSYSFLYDLGGSGVEGARLSDAYIQYDGLAPFHFRTGAFITPGGIEDQTSVADLIFLERPAPADIARGFGGGDGRKNLISIFANGDDYYAAATLSGARAADTGFFDHQQAAVGRLAYRVLKTPEANVLVSATGTYVFKVADTGAGPVASSPVTFQTGPENAVDGTKLISTGAINARKVSVWGVESAANWKNFYGQAGYFGYGAARRASALPDPNFDGWYVQGTWVLTGESRPYNATNAVFGSPKPAKPFDLAKGDLGAWELAGRYSVTDLDFNAGTAGANVIASGGIRGGRQEGYAVGLNWYPNPVLRFLLDYQHLNVLRLGTAAPFGQIGEKVDIAAARAQFAF